MENNYLAHHGVKGMKWGVRRYQNQDGTRTALGKIHEKTSSPEFKEKAKKAGKAAALGATAVVGGIAVSKIAKSPLTAKGIKAAKGVAKQSAKKLVNNLPDSISNAGKNAVEVALTGALLYSYEKHLDRKYGDPEVSRRIMKYGREPKKK